MNKNRIALLVCMLLFAVSGGLLAQRATTGLPASQSLKQPMSSRNVSSNALLSPLVGPVFPPPLGVNWLSPGTPDLIGRASGKDWYESGVNLAGSTTVYWGPVDGDVLLSLDGPTFTPAESLVYAPGSSNLANGVAVWSGGSNYFDKLNNGPFAIGTLFTMTVTDSITGLPIALTPAASVGLPTNVGAVIPVTAGLHFRVNMEFTVFGSPAPALDFFDANINGLSGPAQSSFGAGFYYQNIPPTISNIADTATNKNVAIGPIPFTDGDVESPPALLTVTAYSSNTLLVPNANILLGGLGNSRDITITPATDQIGTSTITVTVFDGVDSTSDSFVLTVKLPVEFDPASTSVNFGNVQIGASKEDSVLISNPGTDILHITSATSSNPVFSVNPSFANIPGTGSLMFHFFYAPTGPTADSGAVHFIHDGVTSPDSIMLSGNGVMRIITRKYKDGDGSAATTGDQVAKSWHLAAYKDSVSVGTLLGQANAAQLTVDNLAPGLYIVTEADSGASWHRINGNLTRYDTLTLVSTPVTIDSFVNFRPNTITVSKFQDNDGSFGTAGDRTAKGWHLEIHQGSAGGPLVTGGNAPVVSSNTLADGIYYAVEADSANWTHLGYVLNGTPTSGNANAVAVAVTGGESATVDFVNAPPAYSQSYRSFRQDSIAYSKDNAGKLGKLVKRKNAKVAFCAVLVNVAAGANGLHAEFGVGIDNGFPFYTVPASTPTPADPKFVKWDFVFGGSLNIGDTVKVYGFGNKGKLQKVSKYFWKIGGIQSGASLKNPPFTQNDLKLPMPNRINALYEAYNLGAYTSTGGLLVGKVRSNAPDSSKFYGWVLHKKYGDVMKSLYTSKALPPVHDGPPRGFDFLKGQSKLPRSKHNNVLFANLVALKLSISASALGMTPPGLGELVFDDGGSNPLNGEMVKDLVTIGDSLVMGYYQTGVHQYASPSDFQNLSATIAKIDSAFEGPIDTTSFGSSLVFKGVRPLIDVPFLHVDPSIPPTRITPMYVGILETPVAYALLQNYPNPFNPTTTIQFNLPEAAMVSLKVYNMLGQEVATLADNQLLDDGEQEFTFDASRFASGVYFYRLVAVSIPDEESGTVPRTTVLSMKMMLVK